MSLSSFIDRYVQTRSQMPMLYVKVCHIFAFHLSSYLQRYIPRFRALTSHLVAFIIPNVASAGILTWEIDLPPRHQAAKSLAESAARTFEAM